MPNDPSSPPTTKSETPKAPEGNAAQVEYDDFGLPIRKPRQHSHVSEGGETEERASRTTKHSPEPSAEPPEQAKSPNVQSVDSKKDDIMNEKEVNGLTENEKEHGTSNARPKTPPESQSITSPPPQKSPTSPIAKTRASAPGGPAVSEWSHQQLAPQTHNETTEEEEEGWQEMPAYAPFDIYDDDNKLIAREAAPEAAVDDYAQQLGGAAKGYTRVQMDEDAQSATSMDDNTAYLFKEKGTNVVDEDEDESSRDPLSQMQTTKALLTEGQRIAYVGLVRLAIVQMMKQQEEMEKTKATKSVVNLAAESMQMWAQKMMVRIYGHMEIDSSEQVMIEQLAEHGVEPGDLTPALMQNARVKNPVAEEVSSGRPSMASPRPDCATSKSPSMSATNIQESAPTPPPPPYQEHQGDELPAVKTPSQLPSTKNIDIDLRWTVLCDLFLVLIADSVYDARSRQLLERVGGYLDVPWLEICRFEKRVTDALEMQEAADKENWNEDEHMESRRKRARNRRLAMMGLATVGGGLVIGLSAGLLAPVIGAGLAAGFTTIGVAGTSSFLAGAGGAAIITTTGVVSGSTIGVRAANRRTGAVKTFEYRPLHNNKRVNLIVTISGWMSGKVDDVRLPYSTVDPIMGDIYSVLWEPEMLRSMGDTINILATEALTQGLQQVLGSTILVALMAALQLPVVLTKLSYLIDNPWSVSQARADLAGLILADSLIDRNLGSRPITLVGFSLGSRVIFACLRELANRGAYGIIQNAYLFGTPIVAKKDEYIKAKAVVSGRFVNGYATNDWILGYLFRATSGGIMSVAGLAPVEVPGIENLDVTSLVPGHMAYRAAMPRLLREVGWMVESDEFAEIEDPDPENHEARQRELINEIEEARKDLEKKPEKKRFNFFRKQKLDKKEWEVYDETSKEGVAKANGEGPEGKDGPVLFDVDAIRAEATDIASQGFEVKQLESTLPPMKIEITSPRTPVSPRNLRETKSYNDSIGLSPKPDTNSTDLSVPSHGQRTSRTSYDEYDEFAQDEDNVSMTFDTSFKESPAPSPSKSPNLASQEPSPSTWETPAERPPLKSASTMPNVNTAPDYNAWADEFEDEFGKEKEMKMTFE